MNYHTNNEPDGGNAGAGNKHDEQQGENKLQSV